MHACWVAVAEGARGRGKGGSSARAARRLGLAMLAGGLGGAAGAAAPPPPNALPGGAQLVAGQSSIASHGAQMTVTQQSAQAIINWQRFDIGADAAVRFDQPSASAVALNRVIGSDPSQIYGKLSSNGSVFLINPQGVLFGAGAQVNVGALAASSLGLADSAFLAGRYEFSGAGTAGAVRNAGSIAAATGGYVALIGPSVANSGSISAPQGSVALAAGEQVGVDLRGDGLVSVRVTRGALKALADNAGLIVADGGQVVLTAAAADALTRSSVNNSGVVQARGLLADGGSIRLVGDGEVYAGALDVSSAHGAGGSIGVGGASVSLDGRLNADGARGGAIQVDATGNLSVAAGASAAGLAGDGGAIAYRAGAMLVENVNASSSVNGSAGGGGTVLAAGAGVLSSGRHSAQGATGAGGRIDVSGADVRLLGAQLDASGQTRGGLVRVGGAFQGGAARADAPDAARFVTRWGATAAIANANATFIGGGSTIDVSARGAAAQGGTAVVWSQQQTTMLGALKAGGGGAGGTVEISSKNDLRYVDLEQIVAGRGGQLLLDPKNLTIGNTASSWTYQAILGNGYGNVTGASAVVDPRAGEGYGASVALNAAGDVLAVGAPYNAGAAGTASATGAVRLYGFSGANYANVVLRSTLGLGYGGAGNLNIALDPNAQFGSSVALNADASRLAVGALGANGGLGQVRLFTLGATPVGYAVINGGSGNQSRAAAFGSAVALNADGSKLAVGALADQGYDNHANSGAVYLYTAANAAPVFSRVLSSSSNSGSSIYNTGLAADAQYGTAVALNAAGDKLAVGAVGVDDGKGAVYLYTNPFAGIAKVATLGLGYSGANNLNLPLMDGAMFGSSVALNASGSVLAVGAASDGAYGATELGGGSVRIINFGADFAAPRLGATLGGGYTGANDVNLTLSPWESFGYALALNAAGDRLAVGAPYADGGSGSVAGSGNVRIFNMGSQAVGNIPYSYGGLGSSALIDAAALATALKAGTSITLQASNDITLLAGNPLDAGAGSAGASLSLSAGRSIALNSAVTLAAGGSLTLTANDSLAHGVIDNYRDAGAAGITLAAGADVTAANVAITIGNDTAKTNSGTGSIGINSSVSGTTVSVKNLGANGGGGDVLLGASGVLRGGGSGTTIEVVATANFKNGNTSDAATHGLNAGAGRYLVYTGSPAQTVGRVTGYAKHYAQSYTGSTPAYAASGNWFLYSATPTLTVNAAAAGKTYDGLSTAPTLGYNVGGLIDGDTAAILSGALAVNGLSKNAGSYAIDLGTLANSLGYVVNYVGNNLVVAPRALTASVTGVAKVYDGLSNAGVNYADNRLPGDTLTLSGSASFVDKNAGVAKAIDVSGIALSGPDAGNYTLSNGGARASADITPRALTVAAASAGKTYDGLKDAVVTLSDDHVGNDRLTLSSAAGSYADKDVGVNKTVSVAGIVLGGADAANYTLSATTATTQAGIAPRTLTASLSAGDKIYDGRTAASATLGADQLSGDSVTLSGGAAAFADKDVGAGKTVTVGGLTLGGADAHNYTLADTSVSGRASITPRTLTVAVSGINKIYDGGIGASVGYSDDHLGNDSLSFTSQASFADKNAAGGKPVSVSGITLGGADARNYTLAATSGSTSASIAPRLLTASASSAGKVYDGLSDAVVVLGDDRVGGDRLALANAGAAYADKSAGLNKAIAVHGISLSGDDAGNYTLASSAATAHAAITPRTLNASASGVNKVYDGGTGAAVTYNDNRLAGDVLGYTESALFADKNVATGTAVSVSAIALTGPDAGNYTLASTSASTSANITPRTLTAGATASKVYDGLATVSASIVDDRVVGDDLVLSAAGGATSFADKNVGTGKALTLRGVSLSGADARNYVLASTTANGSGSITKRTLTASISADDKVYDGQTTAVVRFGDDHLAGDALSLSASGSFDDKNAGSGKTVTLGGVTLGGADAGNYQMAATPASTTASITPRALTVGASSAGKVYDRLTGAVVTLSGDAIAGDTLVLASAAADYADKDVGANKTIAVSGITLSGGDARNYTLASTVATAHAGITAKALTVTVSGASKVYDGLAGASATLGDDRLGGDDLTVAAGSASYADKNVGAAKALSVGGLALSGNDARNYVLSSTVATGRGAITARALNATAAGVDKIYDGLTTAALTYADDRVAGDALNFSAGAAFADKNAGSAKLITMGGVTLAGLDAGNYTLNFAGGPVSANITPRTLQVSAAGASKVYDGGTATSASLSDNRLAGDRIVVSGGGASFADKNVGNGKALTVQGVTLGGADAANYRLASSGASGTGSITARALNVSASAADKVYDGSVATTAALSDDRLSGDSLSVGSAGASFADKNAGSGKLVTVNGLVLAGADAGNYTLASSSASATASIERKTLSAAIDGVVVKNYDGTTAAVIDGGKLALSGFAAGESASVARANGVYNNANVVGASSVSATLSAADVTAGAATLLSNYLLPSGASGAGAIVPKALSVGGIVAAAKTYDGNVAATLSNNGSLSGLVSGESLGFGGTLSASFDNRNAGSAKLVTVSGYTLTDGANGRASNYQLGAASATTTASINQAALTVRANDAARSAGAANPALGYSVSGLLGGDNDGLVRATVSTAATAQSAAGAYGIKVAGPELANYKVNWVDGVLTVTGAPAPTPAEQQLATAVTSIVRPVLIATPPAGSPDLNVFSVPSAPAPTPATLAGAVSAGGNNSLGASTGGNANVNSNDGAVGRNGAPNPAAQTTTSTLPGGTQVLAINGGIRTEE
ncbi:filamentous hemagglutinin N-terminal domain-containing protein [Rugamonas sp. CCM 8940]|nr:filamentous hemagglutinin N-terminal domain-containing protein [Rugamonas sp. CCM 8940]